MNNLNFFTQKGSFQSFQKEVSITNNFSIIRLWLDTKFHFKHKTLNFWTKFVQKEYFRSKTEKVNIIAKFRSFELVLVPNFELVQTILIFWTKYPQKGTSNLKQKMNITVEFSTFALA